MQLAGGRQIRDSMIKLLEARGAYVDGQGDARTSQIGHPLLVKGALVNKPGFWLFKAKALAALEDLNSRRKAATIQRRLYRSLKTSAWDSVSGLIFWPRNIRNNLAVSSSSSVAYWAFSSVVPATTGP